MIFVRISCVAVILFTAMHCTTPAHYQYQRTVPGADGTVYVQALKLQPRGIYTAKTPVILNCKLRGENLNCDRELQINIDTTYWQGGKYFQKDVAP